MLASLMHLKCSLLANTSPNFPGGEDNFPLYLSPIRVGRKPTPILIGKTKINVEPLLKKTNQ